MMGPETVRVSLGDRSYDVLVGPGLIARAGEHLKALSGWKGRLAIVTDRNVAAHWLPPLSDSLGSAGLAAEALVLEPGEARKGWDGLRAVTEWLLAQRIERRGLVIALGGGVIGDLAGFAAAVLRRGVGFVQIPTSLLAQVDSSVGGKTGINSPQGKNLIGAFHQPRLVLADTDVLKTLPEREFRAGYAEVVKYGLLGDRDFYDWLERHGPDLAAGDPAARIHAVRHSCAMKAGIVARDETEEGERALLNLGHTFGHALEAATGYSDRLLHGEAVAIGCVLALELSAELGHSGGQDTERVRAHLRVMGMRAALSDIPGDLPGADRLLELMAQDKKVRDGGLTLILSQGIGRAFVARNCDPAPIRALLDRALSAR